MSGRNEKAELVPKAARTAAKNGNEARRAAKKAKDFAEADRIREELRAMGIELTDLPGGVMWKRV